LKGLVVFDTSYGNTKTIAETILATLREFEIDVDDLPVKEVKKTSAKEYDFLVVGSPTRFGTMSLSIRGFLRKVKSEEWANKPFAAFDTENPENIEKNEGSAAEKIAENLRDKRLNQLLPVLKAVVYDMKGPLKEGEIERAKEYARRLAVELK
jgi:menaquinone-dependent protoporphyrinogen IX oxidase